MRTTFLASEMSTAFVSLDLVAAAGLGTLLGGPRNLAQCRIFILSCFERSFLLPFRRVCEDLNCRLFLLQLRFQLEGVDGSEVRAERCLVWTKEAMPFVAAEALPFWLALWEKGKYSHEVPTIDREVPPGP